MKKIIFDFDGTLVNSMPYYGGAMIKVLEVHDINYPSDIIKTVTPLGYIGTAKYYIENFGIKSSVCELTALMTEFLLHEYTYNIVAKDTVPETLKKLKSEGYSLNVLTASPHSMLDVCLRREGLFELFDNVWSCEDFGTTKSDVNIYHMAAARLSDIAENCIFVDDNIGAVTTAKKSGMTVVGIYDESSADMRAEIAAAADAYIHIMEELPQVL